LSATSFTRVGKVSADNLPALVVFFAGIAAMSIMLSISFRDKHPS
jgi:formate-dependent nitrite reductase membrane component NrfD